MADVSRRLGVSTHSLYKWIRLQKIPAVQRQEQVSQSEALRQVKTELKWITEERDILKSGYVVRSSVRMKYAFNAKRRPPGFE